MRARHGMRSGAPPRWAVAGVPAIVERRVDFIAEFSVILCRGADGACAVWDTPENAHRDGILHVSTVPARPEILAQAPAAIALAKAVAEKLDHIGVLTCEFFATAAGPVFNEMAPRVHNSGHWTIEGAVTSQFENHIRAICGLPLGETDAARRAHAAMLEPDRRRGGRLADAFLADPARQAAPLRQTAGAPRPQDGSRHVGARRLKPDREA